MHRCLQFSCFLSLFSGDLVKVHWWSTGKGGHTSQLVRAAVQRLGHKQVTSQQCTVTCNKSQTSIEAVQLGRRCLSQGGHWTPCPVVQDERSRVRRKSWTLDPVSNRQCDTVLAKLFFLSPSSASSSLLTSSPSSKSSTSSSSLMNRGLHQFPIFCWT